MPIINLIPTFGVNSNFLHFYNDSHVRILCVSVHTKPRVLYRRVAMRPTGRKMALVAALATATTTILGEPSKFFYA